MLQGVNPPSSELMLPKPPWSATAPHQSGRPPLAAIPPCQTPLGHTHPGPAPAITCTVAPIRTSDSNEQFERDIVRTLRYFFTILGFDITFFVPKVQFYLVKVMFFVP
jgi:hypothetical protein